MKVQLQQLLDKFDALNQRERISVMLLTLVGIFVVFLELIITPLGQQLDTESNQNLSLQTQSNQLANQIALLKTKRNLDPDFQEKQKIRLIDEQLLNLNERLKEKMHGLIEPTQMAKVLEVVLNQNTDLKLHRVQSLGAIPLSSLSAKTTDSQQELGIYRHGLQIEFKGSYLSTLKYLKALDALPWNFYWDVLELKVEKYPVSSIILTVHTLSFHEGWIGV